MATHCTEIYQSLEEAVAVGLQAWQEAGIPKLHLETHTYYIYMNRARE